MFPVKRSDLINVLNFLEEKAEPAYQKTLKEVMNREEMLMKAERAFELEKQINTFLDQVDKLQAEKDQHVNDLLNAVDKIKGKSIKIGNILMMVHETIQKNPRKVNYQYKKILNAILEVYDIETKFIGKLKRKYKTITQGSTHVSKELEMQREAKIAKLTRFVESKTGKKVILKENIFSWIANNIGGLVLFFDKWYKTLAIHADEIYEMFEKTHEIVHHSGVFEVKESDSSFFPSATKPKVAPIGVDTKVVKGDKKLHEENETENLKEAIKTLKKLSKKNIKLEAMNRPDEQRAMGKKPVLDADQHSDEGMKNILFSGEIQFMKKNLIPILKQKDIKYRLNKSEDRYGMNLLEVTVKENDLIQVNLKPETIGKILEKKDKSDLYGGWMYENELQERTGDEVKAITGVHKINEDLDAEQYGEEFSFEDWIAQVSNELMKFNSNRDGILGSVFNYLNSYLNFAFKNQENPKDVAKQVYYRVKHDPSLQEQTNDEIKAITGKHKMNEMRPDEIAVTTGKTRRMVDADEHLDEVQDLEEEDYPWNKCMRDQKKEYGSKETAKKVCGSIKAKSGK